MHTFHLFVEPLAPPGGPADRPRSAPSGTAAPHCLEVPDGVSYLSAVPGHAPQLAARAPADLEQAVVLEPVQEGVQPRLALLSPSEYTPRVNGQRAPRLVLLGERDQVQLPGDDHVLHVTLFHRPRVGPPPERLVGEECPVCRLRFTPETTVYLCPCGAAVHNEGPEKPEGERLECLQLGSECPVCTAPVVLTQGYSYVPEL